LSNYRDKTRFLQLVINKYVKKGPTTNTVSRKRKCEDEDEDEDKDEDEDEDEDEKEEEEEEEEVNPSLTRRFGQGAFREKLLLHYPSCAVTGTTEPAVLEAAHIIPVSKMNVITEQNDIKNGILFAADIHTLFDKGQLAIDNQYRVMLSQKLRAQERYKKYNGQKLFLPKKKYTNQALRQ